MTLVIHQRMNIRQVAGRTERVPRNLNLWVDVCEELEE